MLTKNPCLSWTDDDNTTDDTCWSSLPAPDDMDADSQIAIFEEYM